MDMMNLERLGPDKYRVRFKYKNTLTGRQRIFNRVFYGTLEEARAWRDEMKVEARHGELEGARAERKTVMDFVSSYSQFRTTRSSKYGKPVRAATRERDYYALKHHILPEIGDWYLDGIQLDDLEGLVDMWLDKGKPGGGSYAPSSVNTWIKVLKVFLGHACRMAGIACVADDLSNVADDGCQAGRALEADDASQFCAKVGEMYPQWYAFVVVGFTTGARFSEISALRWEDIDEGQGVLHIRRSQYRGHRSALTKTHRALRIPLRPVVAEILRRHRRRMIEEQHPGLSTGLVFPSEVVDGAQHGHLASSALRKIMRRVSADLGIARVTPHDMRRTFTTISHALQRTDAHVIEAIVGHTTEAVHRSYDRVSDERKAKHLDLVLEELRL